MTKITIDKGFLNIPDSTPPSTPSTGFGVVYVDSGDGFLKTKYDSGAVDQMVVPDGFKQEVAYHKSEVDESVWVIRGWDYENPDYSDLYVELNIRTNNQTGGNLYVLPNAVDAGDEGGPSSHDGWASYAYSATGANASGYRPNTGIEGLFNNLTILPNQDLDPITLQLTIRFWNWNVVDRRTYWMAKLTSHLPATSDYISLWSGIWKSHSPLSNLMVSQSQGAMAINSYYRVFVQ